HATLVALIACLGVVTANAQPSIVIPERGQGQDQGAGPNAGVEMPLTLPTDPEVVDPSKLGDDKADGKPRDDKAREAPTQASVALEAPVDPTTYVCGPGDGFELDFWGKQNFQLRIGVDVEGRAFIAKLGHVKVAGLKLDQVRQSITRAAKRAYPGVD